MPHYFSCSPSYGNKVLKIALNYDILREKYYKRQIISYKNQTIKIPLLPQYVQKGNHPKRPNKQNGMDADLAADGVHPTKKDFEVMKGLVLSVIIKVLK